MTTISLKGSLKNALPEEFSDTILQHVSGSAFFCETLLQIIDTDIHAVNLTEFLEESILSISNNEDIQNLFGYSIGKIIDLNGVESAWLQYYLPRIYVFFKTTTFAGKRYDRNSLSILFKNLKNSGHVEMSLINRSISKGKKQLKLFSRKCKNEDWYYDIKNILDTVQENINRKIKQNTIPLFFIIMKSIEPKFIDELMTNFEKRMNMSLILRMNR